LRALAALQRVLVPGVHMTEVSGMIAVRERHHTELKIPSSCLMTSTKLNGW
jgi:hypothetical protein